MEAVNSIFGNAGQISFYGHLGGSYQFTHCTFANYWNKSFRNLPAVLLDNYQTAEDQNTISVPLEKADFRNCIIDGTNPIEMLLEKNSSAAFNFKLDLAFWPSMTFLGFTHRILCMISLTVVYTTSSLET